MNFDDPTLWVINLDLSHLTQQEIEHLHALKNLAQRQILGQWINKNREAMP